MLDIFNTRVCYRISRHWISESVYDRLLVRITCRGTLIRGVEGYICSIKSRKYHHNTDLFPESELPKNFFNAYRLAESGNSTADQESREELGTLLRR